MTQLSLSRGLLSGLLLACACTVSQASMDLFLKLTDREGESLDKEHAKEIDVLAWSWGVSNSGPAPVGGAGAGKASFQDLSITKYTDRSTPLLMDDTAKGTIFPRAVLYVRKSGLKPVQFYRVVCERVLVTSVQVGGSGGEDRLTETISLNCARIGVEYIRIDPTGVSKPPVTFAFNIPENVVGGVEFSDTPPPNPDSDGDGLPDVWERQFGTNPNLKDASGDLDGDGATNYEEFLAGTDPSKRDSVFVARLDYAPGARIGTLSWKSVAGLGYKIFVSETADGVFSELQTVPSSGDGVTSTLVPADVARKFFRVQAVPAQ